MLRRSLRLVSQLATLSQSRNPISAYDELLSCLQGREGSRGVLALFESKFRAPFRAAKNDVERHGRLEQFCGSSDSIEDVVVLMMKVYADHNRLEDVRFVFVLGIQELPRPSTYMLNTFLMCILRTDSFNEFEIENVVELCRLRSITRDVATELCLFILQLRMGQNVISMWPAIHKSCEAVVVPSDSTRRQPAHVPYITHLLRDALVVLVTCHYDFCAAAEAFRLVKIADETLLTPLTLLPLLTVIATNRAAPARLAVEVLTLLRAPATATAASSGSSETAVNQPFELTEHTAVKLLQRCFVERDSDSAIFFQQLIAVTPSLQQSMVRDNLHHLALGAHAAAGKIALALDILEDDIQDPLNGSAATYSVDQTQNTAFGTDCPFQALVRAIASKAGSPVNLDEVLGMLHHRVQQGRGVTVRSLNMLLGAAALVSDARACSQLLNKTFGEFNQTPTAESFTLAAQCFMHQRNPSLMEQLVNNMTAMKLAPPKTFLGVHLQWALNVGNCRQAMAVIQVHKNENIGMDQRLCVKLLKQLCVIGDVKNVELVLDSMKSTNTPPPDPKTISLITAYLAKYGMQLKKV